MAFILFVPNLSFAQIDMDKQLKNRREKEDTYDDSDADRHGDNMTSFYLMKRLGDKKLAFVDTIKLNYFHRAFIEGLSIAESYNGTYASPYQSKIYFDRPLNKWDEFYFTNPYEHLIHRGKQQQWYNVKVPYTFIKYTQGGADQNKEQNFNFKFSSNLGPKWTFGGDVDIDYANGYYAFTKAKNITYRLFGSYEGDRYKAYASIGNTNTINQENGGITDPRFITNPNDFADGKRKLLPKDIPTKYKSTWNRVVYGEGRFHHKYSLGFYKKLDDDGNIIDNTQKVNEVGPQEGGQMSTPPLPDIKIPDETGADPELLEAPTPPEEVTEELGKDSTETSDKKTLDSEDEENEDEHSLNDVPSKPDDTEDEPPLKDKDKDEKIAPPVRKRAGKSSGQALTENDDENENKEEKPTRVFIPVTNIFHDISFQKGRRSWVSQDPVFSELYPDPIIPRPNGSKFFPNDRFYAMKISNTLGIELMEGFHKWAKMGIAAFVAYDHEEYKQPLMNKDDAERLEVEQEVIKEKQNTTYVGGRISSNSFKYFKYYIWGQIGVAGAQAGEMEISGELTTSLKILKKDVAARATIDILNTPPSYFLRHYKASIHEWQQELDMIQVMRLGGELIVPFTKTRIHANVETLQNPIKVNEKAEPEQVKTNSRVLAIGLDQKLSWSILNWENNVVWQKSSNDNITPLPEWAIYSNFYIQTLIAKVMTLQLGVDAKWHTKYYAPYYEPSTQLFMPQDKVQIGGEAPLLSAYANVHLKRARFFVKYYNIGALVFRPNYFSMPYYPLYPPLFRLGIAIDLRN